MPTYYTRKNQIPSGSTIGFRIGKGYYIKKTAAENLVDSQLAPLFVSQATAEKKQATDQAAAQAALKGFTKELLNVLSGAPSRIGQDYDNALAQQTALSQAASRGLAAASPNAQTQADLGAIGAGAQQQAALAAQDAFPGLAGVLFTAQGSVPGQALAASKAAAQQYAEGLPAVASSTSLLGLKNLLYQGSQQKADLAAKRAEINAQRPGLIQQAEAAIAKQAADAQEAQIKAALAESLIGSRALSGQVAVQNAKTSAFRANTAARQGDARLAQGGYALKLRQVQNDRNYQATLRRLGISEANLKLRANQIEAKRRVGGLSASKVKQLQKAAGVIAGKAWNGVEGKDETGVYLEHMTYQEAIREMLTQGIPLTIAQRALNYYWSKPGLTAEWEKRGEGRPYIKFQTRQRLKKKRGTGGK